MTGELKINDYWFLGTDFSIQVENCQINIETGPAVHHFVSYRNWRVQHDYVDGTEIGIIVHSLESLPSDEWDRIWADHHKRCAELAKNRRQ